MDDRQLTIEGEKHDLEAVITGSVHARTTDPITSKEAATSHLPSKNAMVWRVLNYFYNTVVPRSDDEVVAVVRTDMRGRRIERGTIARRRKDLEQRGWVEIVDREGRNDRGSRVGRYRITDDGKAAWQEWMRSRGLEPW